ncbi:MAG: ferrous iron transporter B [Candidatus Melainabacteria bacterium]|nr:ferrous iron transporter B [Candidatus Melainabacteria bacterium]
MNNTLKTHHKQIALVGNPNVGKSVFFHHISSIYVDVSNYPGTTVEITSAPIANNTVIKDTPGIYGVSSFNDEERVARDVILYADIIVNVVSAISLERDLFLTKQLIDMNKDLIIAINQMDEARALGLEININKLSELLGVPIYPTVAITGEGMKEVKEAIEINKAKKGNVDPVLQRELTELLPLVTNQAEALLILEGDLIIAERLKTEPRNKRNEIYSTRRKEVNDLISKTTNKSNTKERFLTKISNILIDPIWGSLAAILIGFLFLYQFLGIWVGGDLVNFTEKKIMNAYYEPVVREATGVFLPIEIVIKDNSPRKTLIYSFPKGFWADKKKYEELKSYRKNNKTIEQEYFFGPSDYIEAKANEIRMGNLKNNFFSALGTILSGKYGVLTLTVTYLLGLLLPLVIAFYTALALLEDSGYLPRLAVLVDGLLSRIGMNGRAIIPLILGLGCVTMASVTTRLLSTKREKIIAMTILGFAIPCSAQLGVIQSLLAKSGGITSWLIWLSVLGLVLVLTGFIMNKFLPGKATPLLIDLPPLRLPRIENVFYKAKTKVGFFMSEAVGAFFLAACIVAFLQVMGILSKIILLFEPISKTFLHLPKEVSISFILGMVRRDFGAFGLTELSMSPAQVTVASVVLTLFVPCIATVAVMAKEQNWKIATGIWVTSMLLAIGIGAILARMLGA